MELEYAELLLLTDAAGRAGRPVTIDWENRTLTVLQNTDPGARKLYVIRDNGNGSITVTDRQN